MEEMIINKLIEIGVFALLFVLLVFYVLRESKSREDKLNNTVDRLHNTIDESNNTNKELLNTNKKLSDTNKELSETNKILALNLTNEVGAVKLQVAHIDDKIDDIKNHIRIKEK